MMDVREILQKVKNNELSIADAEAYFRRAPFEELGYAKLDTHRYSRSGFAEVVFCSGKTDEQLVQIFKHLVLDRGEALGTRATQDQYERLCEIFPDMQYDPVSRLLKIVSANKELRGRVVVCTAGTADIPVAEEAAQTAEYFGVYVERIYDVGVSGLHRLLAHLERIQSSYCVIAVAGMEGALASVLGGLVRNPVIGVPTSVGYGAGAQGVSALLTMLNSCANGVATVNIDNGYGAGYLAAQINRLALQKGEG